MEDRPVVGSAHCLGVMRLRWGPSGDGAAWACNQGRRGHGRLPCLPGTNSPPPAKTHLPQAPGATTARAAGCGARPWLGAQGDGRTDRQTAPRWPQTSATRAAAGFHAPPRPFREPRPGARGGTGGGEADAPPSLGAWDASGVGPAGDRLPDAGDHPSCLHSGPCAPPPWGPQRGLRGDHFLTLERPLGAAG